MDKTSESFSVALGVEHLAPQERNATSEDPFQKSARIRRSPPTVTSGLLETAKENGQAGKPTAARKILAECKNPKRTPQLEVTTHITEASRITSPNPERTTPVMTRNPGKAEERQQAVNTLKTEVDKCKGIVKKMKNTCGRQKNISMDIKNGLAELEEALDKMWWEILQREKSDVANTQLLRSPQAHIFQQEISGDRSETPRKNPATRKRPPSSPLTKEVEKKTRKVPKALTPLRKELAANGITSSQTEDVQTPTIDLEAQKNFQIGKKKRPKGATEISLQKEQAQKKHKAEAEKAKKRRENTEEGVAAKKRQHKSRPDAILIRPRGTETYAEILREIRTKANPDDTETVIITVRQTKTGDILLELGSKTKDKEAFGNSLKNILGEKATVQSLEPKITLEIRDMDELTTTEEVQSAITNALNGQITDIQVFVTKTNRSALKMALVQVSARAANELLKTARIKIGWVQCRIRRRVIVTRCYKCFGYGHQQADCKGIDRKNLGLCFNCGEEGHKKN